MRHVVAQARFEHAEAFGHAHRPAVAVTQIDHAGAALVQRAHAPGQQHQPEQAEVTDQEIVFDAAQYVLLGRRADIGRREILRPPCDAVAFDHATTTLIETEQRQGWNQHGESQQEGCRPLIERLHPQPEIKPDAAVGPRYGDDREHQPLLVRPCDPVGEEYLRIFLVMAEQRLAEPHAGNVGNDERRDAEPEHELQRLDRLPAKLPALVKRPYPETGMNQRRGVEYDRDRQHLPEQDVVIEPRGKRIHRDIAERMGEEMADQIGKQHQSAEKPDLAQADAADELCQLFQRKRVHAIQSSDCRVGIDNNGV